METINIKHIAKLAKLKLEDDKIEKFEEQMQNIITMIENLPEMEGSLEIDPNNRMELRKDEILPSLRRDAILANAPHVVGGCVVVPHTMES